MILGIGIRSLKYDAKKIGSSGVFPDILKIFLEDMILMQFLNLVSKTSEKISQFFENSVKMLVD